MIVSGSMSATLNKKDLKDITIKKAKQILKKPSKTINSLPGNGNMGLKKKVKSQIRKNIYQGLIIIHSN